MGVAVIHPRSAWGARKPKRVHRIPLPTPKLYLHHSAGSGANEEAVKAIQKYHMDVRGWSDIAYCVDEKTEILTDRGWLHVDDLQVGDLALTLNPETFLGEWQPVEAVNRFEALSRGRRMLKSESTSHSSLTTQEHRWLTDNRLHGRGVRRSARLTENDVILAAAPSADLPQEQKWTDDFVALVGWFWTEGHIRPFDEVEITQSHTVNGDHCLDIERRLRAVFGDPVESLRRQSGPAWRISDGANNRRFYLNGEAGRILLEVAPNRVLTPEFITQLTEAQLRLLLDISVKGDGWCRPGGSWSISQRKREQLDAFQMVPQLLGISTVLRYDKRLDMWVLAAYKNPNRRPAKGAEWVTYYGRVWCPTTANGSWLARRDGKPFFTGNSFLIDNDAPDIDIFEGRGPGVAGGHTKGQNTVSHGICVIGNFTKVPPEPETLEAIAVLVAHGHLAGWWPDRITGGHRDAPGAATSCPGDALYRLIPSINRRVKQLLEEPMKVIAGFKWLDYETWPEYAKPSIIKNIEAGVIRGRDVKGKPDSKVFDPNTPLSRAEAAVLLDRIGAVR